MFYSNLLNKLLAIFSHTKKKVKEEWLFGYDEHVLVNTLKTVFSFGSYFLKHNI